MRMLVPWANRKALPPDDKLVSWVFGRNQLAVDVIVCVAYAVALERHIAQGDASQIVNRGEAVASLDVVFAVDGVGETEPEIEILNRPVGGNSEALILGSCIDAGERRQAGSCINSDSAIKGRA